MPIKESGSAGDPPAFPGSAGDPPAMNSQNPHLTTVTPGSAGDSPAMNSQNPSAKPPATFRGWHKRSHLPHCDHSSLVQAVTFRLGDSVPKEAHERLERELLLLPKDHREAERRLRIEALLDAGSGECLLARSECAQIVAEVLLHQEGYHLAAWVIMPNHVHVLVHIESPLERTVQAWKSISSKRLNGLLGRQGSRWQSDYWDRFMRDEEHFWAVKKYIEQNPVAAGLVPAAGLWRWSSAYVSNAGESPALPGSQTTARSRHVA